MSKLWARFAGLFSSKNFVGIDKVGNRYFKRIEELDGLNGQRNSAPTPEVNHSLEKCRRGMDPYAFNHSLILKKNKRAKEMAELEARREFVKLNIARLKKEEEERMAKEGKRKATNIGKNDGPELKSFVQQFPDASKGDTNAEASDTQSEKRSSEPTGSGESFRPGTWQPPT